MGSVAVHAAHTFYNQVTKPIAVIEFKEAIDAICHVQHPGATWRCPRTPALAISGGLDSMALAYLFSEFAKTFPLYRICGYPSDTPHAIIVNHNLRPGSEIEAHNTLREVRKLGLKGQVRNIRWRDYRRQGLDPSELPNLESLARTMRYYWLGRACRGLKSPSLFTAHHQDDQYETVLMRLLAGHGYRGLLGMRNSNDVPETQGMYAVHRSGLLQEVHGRKPLIMFRPSNSQTKMLRRFFIDDHKQRSNEPQDDPVSLDGLHFHTGIAPPEDYDGPHLEPLKSEDGGVKIYRPMLAFSKDRLRATCEARKVTWFEDHTNHDPTMTMRNAVRHLVNHHTLPKALQKPAILSLCETSQLRHDAEEAEARRLLVREAVIEDFDSCAGTLIAKLPTFHPSRRGIGRCHDAARTEQRKPHQRLLAALVIRTLIDYVTPEYNLPAISALGNVVNRLFPELDKDTEAVCGRPVSFSIGGVLFEPIFRPGSVRWYLSRAPYTASKRPPDVFVDWRDENLSLKSKEREEDPVEIEEQKRYGWRQILIPRCWDGRFWVSVASCVHDRFHIRPYYPEHAKAFRESLPPKERAHLEKILKYYAPGKVRTTLPALYRASAASVHGVVERHQLTMLALPSLDIKLKGLEQWIKYDISYKNWDRSLVGLKKRGTAQSLAGYQPAMSKSRARRLMRQRFRCGNAGRSM